MSLLKCRVVNPQNMSLCWNLFEFSGGKADQACCMLFFVAFHTNESIVFCIELQSKRTVSGFNACQLVRMKREDS